MLATSPPKNKSLFVHCVRLAVFTTARDGRYETLILSQPCVLISSICEGISPLGYWQKVNQSPTQTKPYNTLPPFEPRDSWSSYGAVRAYSDVLL